MFFAGIVNPIEAKVRKGKGAVGAYGNERTQQSIQDFPVVDSEEEEEKVSGFRIELLVDFSCQFSGMNTSSCTQTILR